MATEFVTAPVSQILPAELDLTVDGASFQLDRHDGRWSVRRIEGRAAILLGHLFRDGGAWVAVARDHVEVARVAEHVDAVRQLTAAVALLPAGR